MAVREIPIHFKAVLLKPFDPVFVRLAVDVVMSALIR
jgi:hypothetical protein